MVELKKQQQQKESSNWWWFDRLSLSNSNQKRSTWLQSTLSDLDEKTKAMLKLIEEDGDTFSQRAEMYYKKRPELISMVEEFYRTHRSLAERYEQFKSESGTRLITPWASPLSMTKCRPEKLMSLSSMEKSYDIYSETYDTEELEESDIEDPEPEEVQYNKEMVKKEAPSGDDGNSQVIKLMEEVEKLREENRTQKEQLMEKDEEKRDVIRQLSLGMDLLRDENAELRKRVIKDSSAKRQNHFEVNKLDVFWRRPLN
ncbi:hypothetical protein ACH5RR_020082 [Cinchona calisaya]|uniref:NAB domain-containing protein n=1 Tax=Cinchona calisaya TaxID=153742 RepID=A0ABD2ZEI9_9GENT